MADGKPLKINETTLSFTIISYVNVYIELFYEWILSYNNYSKKIEHMDKSCNIKKRNISTERDWSCANFRKTSNKFIKDNQVVDGKNNKQQQITVDA